MKQKVSTYSAIRPKPPGRIRQLLGSLHIRRKPKQVPARPELGADVRKQRMRQQRQATRSRIAAVVRPLLKPALVLAVAVGAIAGVAFLISSLGKSETYILQDIEIMGNEEISSLEIVSVVQDLIGKSMFAFDTNAVEANLREEFPFIKTVFARKVLPGKLEIEIEERQPALAYINLSGVYLIDSDGYVVSELLVDERLPLTSDQLLVANGYGDANANYVYEHYLSKIESEDERAQVKWDEVSPGDKSTALDSLRGEILFDISSRIASHKDVLLVSDFATLLQVEAQSSVVYEPGTQFSEKQFLTVTAVRESLARMSLSTSRYFWSSDFTLHVWADGKELIFTTTRDIELQLLALEAVRTQTNWGGISVIDLQSELVAVR